MRAAIQGSAGLEFADVDPPRIHPHEILVRVRACALNLFDPRMAAGRPSKLGDRPGAVLGSQWAGDIEAVGAEVAHFRPGERVMCSGRGAFGQFAKTDWGRALPMPDGMSYGEAAALSVALPTMHDALFTHGQLQKGQSILVQGASSGVGLVALQLAKLAGASLIIGTSTSTQRRERLGQFGAFLALNSHSGDWVDAVLSATQGEGVDLVVDQVAGPTAIDNLKATRILGRIVNVGRLGGMTGGFDFDLHALRRITYVGVTFRNRTPDEVREVSRRLVADPLWAQIAAGQVRMPIAREFAFQDLKAAIQAVAEDHFGRILIADMP
jgi:NADPH2:quinone reductase